MPNSKHKTKSKLEGIILVLSQFHSSLLQRCKYLLKILNKFYYLDRKFMHCVPIFPAHQLPRCQTPMKDTNEKMKKLSTCLYFSHFHYIYRHTFNLFRNEGVFLQTLLRFLFLNQADNRKLFRLPSSHNLIAN